MKVNVRLTLVIVVSMFVISATILLINYAKGYRPDLEKGGLKATGLLVASSEPKGAQVYLNGELKTATDDTLNLEPADYNVEIRKAGFIPWKKQLKIEKELVTQTEAVLFPITPNLQSLTSSGAQNPSLSPSGTKLLYVVQEANEATATTRLQETARKPHGGIWLMELTNLPLGFNQDPRQLVAGDPPLPDLILEGEMDGWAVAQFLWSPSSREILIFFFPQNYQIEPKNDKKSIAKEKTVPTAVYLLNTGNETVRASELTNINNRYRDILLEWQKESAELLKGQISKLPDKLEDLITTSTAGLKFSPDEKMLLYTATTSAQLDEAYIPPVPAASTQTQERNLVAGRTYVYDLKEDRNFMILDESESAILDECESLKSQPWLLPFIETDINVASCPKLSWFPTSRHLVYFNEGKVSIMEYDSTNNQVVYAGPLESNYVFVHPSPAKLLLVTNLNPDAFPLPNMYSLSLR